MALSRLIEPSAAQMEEDIGFLLEYGFADEHDDGFDSTDTRWSPALQLVRIAYEGENYTGPGMELRNAHDLAACRYVCSRLPPHRSGLPAVREAMRDARDRLWQRNISDCPPGVLFGGLEPDAALHAADQIRLVAERNLGRLLPVLRELLIHARIDCTSVGGEIWDVGLDVVAAPGVGPEAGRKPAVKDLERVAFQEDGTPCVRPWPPRPEDDFWSQLQAVSVDLICLAHPEAFETDAACSIVLSLRRDILEDPREAILSISCKPLLFGPEPASGSEPDGDGPSP